VSEECIHEMAEGTCGLCKPNEGPTWELLYGTHCVVCGHPMSEGTLVKWSLDGEHPVHARH
jgi:hypothetical protein